MTLDTETCLSELQPEGTFTDTWKSDHAPAQRPQGPPAPALPTSEPQVHRPLPAPQRHQLSSSLKALRNSALSRMCFLNAPLPSTYTINIHDHSSQLAQGSPFSPGTTFRKWSLRSRKTGQSLLCAPVSETFFAVTLLWSLSTGL